MQGRERLRWSGNQQAQEQADEAFLKFRAKAIAKRKAGELAAQQAKQLKKRRRKGLPQFIGTYHDYLKSPQWAAKRKKAIAYYRGRCTICTNGHRLEVHHRHYRTLFREGMGDLDLLCHDCHQNHHEDKGAEDSMTQRYLGLARGF
jgi:hypothetical protein